MRPFCLLYVTIDLALQCGDAGHAEITFLATTKPNDSPRSAVSGSPEKVGNGSCGSNSNKGNKQQNRHPKDRGTGRFFHRQVQEQIADLVAQNAALKDAASEASKQAKEAEMEEEKRKKAELVAKAERNRHRPLTDAPDIDFEWKYRLEVNYRFVNIIFALGLIASVAAATFVSTDPFGRPGRRIAHYHCFEADGSIEWSTMMDHVFELIEYEYRGMSGWPFVYLLLFHLLWSVMYVYVRWTMYAFRTIHVYADDWRQDEDCEWNEVDDHQVDRRRVGATIEQARFDESIVYVNVDKFVDTDLITYYWRWVADLIGILEPYPDETTEQHVVEAETYAELIGPNVLRTNQTREEYLDAINRVFPLYSHIRFNRQHALADFDAVAGTKMIAMYYKKYQQFRYPKLGKRKAL